MSATGSSSMKLAFNENECENLVRKAHINYLSYYLLGKEQHDNFVIFNAAAVRILEDKRIRGRRRQLLEKFVGKVAAMRLTHTLKMEDELPWQD
jgi:hypothetical protein